MAIGLKDTIEGSFGRHETFTIRYGWLKRGFDLALVAPSLFYDDDVHHRLGVGKNMARSIRFWLSATRVMTELSDQDDGRRTLMTPTEIGLGLLVGHDARTSEKAYARRLKQLGHPDLVGFDPYLEDLGSWWLLHWLMLSPGGSLPAWWSAFHSLTARTFTVEQLLDHVLAQVGATAAWCTPRPPSDATVKKDVLALLRAYAGTSGSRRADKADDMIDAPMVPLRLVHTTEEPGTFRFAMGPKPGLAPAIAAYACLDFMDRADLGGNQALVPTLAEEVGGPGRAFKLQERDLGDLLAKAAAAHPDLIAFRPLGGSDALHVTSDLPLPEVGARLLEAHYRRLGSPGEVTLPTLTVRPLPDASQVVAA